ncbi:ABC transporter permease [Elongatibacter sediminis]|uniref:Transport permease protein n=1 Tax=Elongatibacter sediminis TaxID=3119006 RepID=A0AAW9RED5_9GAMM
MSWRHFAYVLFQTTRASFLAEEKNSSLGLIWHLLNPILMTAVLFMVFRNVDRLREIEHYELFILIGLVHYNFFINSTTRCAQNFLRSRSLILNTTVPLQLLVLRQTCIEGLTLFIEILLVLVLGVFMGANLGGALLVYPLVFAGILALSLGASLLLCALVVFLSDLNYIWSLFCRMLFFVTPVFFDPQIVGDGLARTVVELNPLTGLITLARDTLLYGGEIDPLETGLALMGSMLVLAFGWILFRTTSPRIPDYI